MMASLSEILKLAEKHETDRPPAPQPVIPRGTEIASWIDHTLLKPDATEAQINQLCQEARQVGFASVCVNPSHVSLAARLVEGSKAVVCKVIGFPPGATLTTSKVFETLACLEDRAREVDMVIPIGALKG